METERNTGKLSKVYLSRKIVYFVAFYAVACCLRPPQRWVPALQNKTLDIQKLLGQDKAKYVENQVQTGCETVRKFCAEVMQDLFLPPDCTVKASVSDTVKVPVSDVSLNYNADVEICKNTKKGFEKCPLNEKTLRPTESEAVVSPGSDLMQAQLNTNLKEANCREECGIPSEKSVPASSNLKDTEGNHLDAVEVVSDISKFQTACSSVIHPVSTSHQNVMERRPKQSGHIASTDAIGIHSCFSFFFVSTSARRSVSLGLLLSYAMPGTNRSVEGGSLGNVPQKSQKINSMAKSSVNLFPKIMLCCCNVLSTVDLYVTAWLKFWESRHVLKLMHIGEFDKFVDKSHSYLILTAKEIRIIDLFTGRLHDFDLEEASKNTDNVEASTDTEEEYEDLKLEASSIDAEARDKSHLLTHQDSRKRSYKKKLRDAFSLKLRFAKKNDDQCQMATLSGAFNAGIEEKDLTASSSTFLVDLDSRKSLMEDSYESEWELL
ncbi:hypothetical protein ACLOJK_010500 [Asimina triloba]